MIDLYLYRAFSVLIGSVFLLAIAGELLWWLRFGEWVDLNYTLQIFIPLNFPLKFSEWAGVSRIVNAVVGFLWAVPLWVYLLLILCGIWVQKGKLETQVSQERRAKEEREKAEEHAKNKQEEREKSDQQDPDWQEVLQRVRREKNLSSDEDK